MLATLLNYILLGHVNQSDFLGKHKKESIEQYYLFIYKKSK